MKSHAFFKGINWDTLLEDPMDHIFIPRPVDALDTGYDVCLYAIQFKCWKVF